MYSLGKILTNTYKLKTIYPDFTLVRAAKFHKNRLWFGVKAINKERGNILYTLIRTFI